MIGSAHTRARQLQFAEPPRLTSRAARRAFAECRIASVDLLLSGRVLEINAFPCADGLLETHGVVLAKRVLDTLEVELDARPADQHDDQQHDDQQRDDQDGSP